MKRMYAGVLAALTALTPLTAKAQIDPNFDLCTVASDPGLMRDVMTMYLGPWQANHQSGYVVVGGMSMPFPNSGDVDTIMFERSGNDLIATHPEMQKPMVFSVNNEPAWSFEAGDSSKGVPAPAITTLDIEAMALCPIEDLPRLIGKTDALVQGTKMEFTWRVTLVGADQMVVVEHITGAMQGMSFFSRRTVLLTR